MNIETTHCDACDTPNIGCLVSRVAGETVLAICPFCVTDDELDSLTEQRLCHWRWPREQDNDSAHDGSPMDLRADRGPALATLFLGAWF
mgnify:CR=1 FL=1